MLLILCTFSTDTSHIVDQQCLLNRYYGSLRAAFSKTSQPLSELTELTY